MGCIKIISVAATSTREQKILMRGKALCFQFLPVYLLPNLVHLKLQHLIPLFVPIQDP